MNRDNYIYERLQVHQNKVKDIYGDKLIYIAAVGSMNYNAFTETSDVDTKAILLPTFEDLVLNKTVSTTLQVDNEECSVKDIRTYISEVKKQGINILETLTTKYYISSEIMNPLRDNAEKIAHLDCKQFVKSASGDCFHKLKLWTKSYIAFMNQETDTVRFKDAYNIIRLCSTIGKYITHVPFSEAIELDKYTRDAALDIKNGLVDAKLVNNIVHQLTDSLSFPQILDERNEETEQWLNMFLFDTVSKYCWRKNK